MLARTAYTRRSIAGSRCRELSSPTRHPRPGVEDTRRLARLVPRKEALMPPASSIALVVFALAIFILTWWIVAHYLRDGSGRGPQ